MGDIDFASLIGPVARRLWGEPSRQHSKPNELRWGTNGSKSVNLFKGVWHDHESNEGGGTLDLVKRETGRIDGEAVAWLQFKASSTGTTRLTSVNPLQRMTMSMRPEIYFFKFADLYQRHFAKDGRTVQVGFGI